MMNPTEEMLRRELAQARRRIAELEAAASNDSALMHAELRAMASQRSFERITAHVLARADGNGSVRIVEHIPKREV
jgi:hypothetical protein